MNTFLQQNFFQLFNLPEQFNIDQQQLDNAYRKLQAQVHPDRYAASPEGQRRLALQWSTLANEAYSTLKQPLKRASYLCKLNGIDIDQESSVDMPIEFLMQQLDWRETLEQAHTPPNQITLDHLHQTIMSERAKQLTQLTQAIDQQQDLPHAAMVLRKLMFIEKFINELENILETTKN